MAASADMARSWKRRATMGAITQDNVNKATCQLVQNGTQPPGNGEIPMTRAWAKSTTRKSTNATRKRQSKYSLARNVLRPDTIAANGRFEVRCANPLHCSPRLRLRLASIDSVPRSDRTKNVPNKTTEA